MHFYQDCAKDRNILNERLKKEPVPWTHEHTRVVQKVKARVKTLPILYVADDILPKIVETNVSNEGWGVVLKQVRAKENKRKVEEILQFSSGVWQDAEKSYAAFDRKIKATLNVVQKFEIFLINKKFVLRPDVAAMNKVLNKEVKKASDAKFARWQALFSNFEFDVEHIKGSKN